MHTLVIRSINLNKYDIKCLNNLMILSIYKEEVEHLFFKIANALYRFWKLTVLNIPRKITDFFSGSNDLPPPFGRHSCAWLALWL